MTNREAALFSLKRAKTILEEAKMLFERKAWNLVVRRSQESVELALKAVLIWAGTDVPKLHDVSRPLRENMDKFPNWFHKLIPRLTSISRSLRAEREMSFYGDEESGTPPEMLYFEEDALEALKKAEFVLESSRRLICG